MTDQTPVTDEDLHKAYEWARMAADNTHDPDDAPWRVAARLFLAHVPAPRVITNPDELDELAEGAVILAQGDPFSYRHARWYSESMALTSTGLITYAETVTVLWEPEV